MYCLSLDKDIQERLEQARRREIKIKEEEDK
ncbi:hypothetical protein LCGC14_0698870 [marine sediment metagenome]|uniref:Uncharacterized protein n=1 Tax=marine sediment metagenome TaxID=412755 RepID=A0A0F9TR71_9ZZZZ